MLTYVGQTTPECSAGVRCGLAVALDFRQVRVNREPGVLGEPVHCPAQRPGEARRLTGAESTSARASAKFSPAVFSIESTAGRPAGIGTEA